MNNEEAKAFGILPSQKFRYLKIVDAKSNLAPRAADSPWYELHSVELPNPEPPLYPFGDNVQAVARINLPLIRAAGAQANDALIQRTILDLVNRGKTIDGKSQPYSLNDTGAKNARKLIDDAMAAVGKATAPQNWIPADLKATVQGSVERMKADGWLYQEQIKTGQFRGGFGAYVDWKKTPWPTAGSASNAADEEALGNVQNDGGRQLRNEVSND
jgi:hypothetical protein